MDIKKIPAKWEVRDDSGVLLGSYSKRSEARIAIKTAALQRLCDQNAKERGSFQPRVV